MSREESVGNYNQRFVDFLNRHGYARLHQTIRRLAKRQGLSLLCCEWDGQTVRIRAAAHFHACIKVEVPFQRLQPVQKAA